MPQVGSKACLAIFDPDCFQSGLSAIVQDHRDYLIILQIVGNVGQAEACIRAIDHDTIKFTIINQ